jgi:hypothetical protein
MQLGVKDVSMQPDLLYLPFSAHAVALTALQAITLRAKIPYNMTSLIEPAATSARRNMGKNRPT